jgi:hypothetical protein
MATRRVDPDRLLGDKGMTVKKSAATILEAESPDAYEEPIDNGIAEALLQKARRHGD